MRQVIAAEKGEKDDDIPNEPPPFYYPASVVASAWLDRHKFGIYPENGGLMNQCPYMIEDLKNATLWYIRVENNHLSAMSSIGMPNSAPDVAEQMGD